MKALQKVSWILLYIGITCLAVATLGSEGIEFLFLPANTAWILVLSLGIIQALFCIESDLRTLPKKIAVFEIPGLVGLSLSFVFGIHCYLTQLSQEVMRLTFIYLLIPTVFFFIGSIIMRAKNDKG